jgi:Tn3 transposase DDE domain
LTRPTEGAHFSRPARKAKAVPTTSALNSAPRRLIVSASAKILHDQINRMSVLQTLDSLRIRSCKRLTRGPEDPNSDNFSKTSGTRPLDNFRFGVFRLLGYRFSPRLADVGGTRLWRVDPHANYGDLNDMSRHKINLRLIAAHWDDLLRLAGSLKLGRVPAAGIMRMLQVGDRPTRLAQALAEFGRIDKTLHILRYIDDERKRRATLLQLNRGEGRHSLARAVFHGKRGELRQRYREGQEDQLGTLGLVVNVIVLWNTIYMNAVLKQLRREGHPVREEDVARLSPLIYEHINLLGRYSFAIPDAVIRGELRALRDPVKEA